MRVSIEWLREFVDFECTPAELADLLTMAGLEVSAVEEVGEEFDGIVVGRMTRLDPHPTADRLVVCQVAVGGETLPIVCGAPNLSVGARVPVALVGTTLPSGATVEEAALHGTVSRGMLCSQEELGFQEHYYGIFLLPDAAPIGTLLADALGWRDTILEFELTPNRPDCLSILGIAREVAALTGGTLHPPQISVAEEGPDISSLTSVTIEDPELCPRYVARVIEGVRIGPSFLKMQRRLITAGMRPLSNIIDATNYVMWELGHPLHAFDYDMLEEHRIVVRRAANGEVLRTLDGIPRELTSEMLIIGDAGRSVALAGIMGGGNSEVTEKTRTALLECAYFHPTSIRRTAKALGMHTEASHRFERGADPDGPISAIDRAISLMQQVAGGTVARGRADGYPNRLPPRRVELRVDRTSQVLGVGLPREDIIHYLARLHLSVQEKDANVLVVDVPSYRVDLEREIDLVEEVARLHGYQQIPVELPAQSPSVVQRDPHGQWEGRIKDIFADIGFSEVITYSFISEKLLKQLRLLDGISPQRLLRLRNSLSAELEIMRPLLVPSILQSVALNMHRNLFDQRLFEVSRVFMPTDEGQLPEERHHLAGALCGRRGSGVWGGENAMVDLFDVKGCLEVLFERLRVPLREYLRAASPFLHPAASFRVVISGTSVGEAGLVHPGIAESFDITKPVYVFELDLEQLFQFRLPTITFKSVPRFPASSRDVAVVVDRTVAAEDVRRTIEHSGVQYLEGVSLFDVYAGKPIASGKKSLAFTLTYRSPDRTLTDEEVNAIHSTFPELLAEKYGASLRKE
jgi:phenylalanyl-tRNA synthetase beta chain